MTLDETTPIAAQRNRSLQRGIEILRAFRPGADLLGTGELAERTGLSPATVSRLAQTLVDSGMLERDRRRRAYRLAPFVLCLAYAMRAGSPLLAVAGPLMRREAEQHRINVGLAVADRDEMLYLESIRYSPRVSWRNVVAGQRVPMELTSLGRAYLAAAGDDVRRPLLAAIRARRRRGWATLSRDIAAAVASVRRTGYCSACWQPGVVAIATPIVMPDRPIYVLNMSTSGAASPRPFVDAFHGRLLDLAGRIRAAVDMP